MNTLSLRVALCLAASLAVAPAAGRAQPKPSGCRMEMSGELKVRWEGSQLLTPVKINGRETSAIVDTGAFVSTLSVPGASAFGLRLQNMDGLQVSGAGGMVQAYRTNMASFEIGGVRLKDRDVVVAGQRNMGAPLLLGRDILGRTDLEFDLKHGVIRLLEPKNCKSESMAYWADKGYSQAPLALGARYAPFHVQVRLNGKPVLAELDSGASVSVATPAAAARAGIKLEGVEEKGRGVGARVLDQSIGDLQSFAIGDETIGRTRLRVADLFRGVGYAGTGTRIAADADGLPEMLLGTDFLRAHRVLIAPSQRMIYFTYEGGPVFDVTRRSEAAPPVAAPVPLKPGA